MTQILRVIFTCNSKSIAALCAAGLLVSCITAITGCTPAAPHNNEQTKATTQTIYQTSKQTAEQTINTKQNSLNNFQELQKQLSTQARIEQLKKDQLQAQTDKAVCSDHTASTIKNFKLTDTTDTAKKNSVGSATQYIVGQGENLYSIANKRKIYNDGLLWPLIYKANRDQIKDPEQIFPGQHLSITHQHSEQEKDTARETARNSGIFIH